jgi:hypothetical protein
MMIMAVSTARALFATSTLAAIALADPVAAQEYTLRIQTHYAPETASGKLAAQFASTTSRPCPAAAWRSRCSTPLPW